MVRSPGEYPDTVPGNDRGRCQYTGPRHTAGKLATVHICSRWYAVKP